MQLRLRATIVTRPIDLPRVRSSPLDDAPVKFTRAMDVYGIERDTLLDGAQNVFAKAFEVEVAGLRASGSRALPVSGMGTGMRFLPRFRLEGRMRMINSSDRCLLSSVFAKLR